MRTLAAMACFTLAALISCSPNIADGRILCASTAPLCPDGYTCQDGRCYRGAPDGGMNLDPLPDAHAAVDAHQDTNAGPAEVCTPSEMRRTVRSDEDSDGRIDEGCALEVDIVHPMTLSLPQVETSMRDASIRFPRLSADGLTLTYCRMERLGEEVWQTTRSTVLSRFGPASRVSFPQVFRACVAQPHRSGYVVEGVRTFGGTTRRIFILGSGTTTEVSTAVVGKGASGHPFLSADGRQLFFEGNRRIEGMSTRSDGLFVTTQTGEGWSAAEAVQFDEVNPMRLRDMFPTLSEDGLTLVFVREVEEGVGARAMVATRSSVDTLEFSQPVEIAGLADMPVGSLTVSLSSWEAFLTSDAPTSTAGRLSTLGRNEGLFHARLCAGNCPPRTGTNEEPCEGVRSADGVRCYTTDGVPRTQAGAVTHCTGVAAPRIRMLASIHSEDERELVRGLATTEGVWVGAQKAADGWTWSSGEPDTDSPGASVFWASGGMSAGACVALNATGFGESTECNALRPAACESDLWPTW